MQTASPAPMFACLYPGLCDLARENGYALAIHGSVVTDLDLIAVPWTHQAIQEEDLMLKMKERLGALNYRELLQRDCGSWATDKQIDQMVHGEYQRLNEPRGELECTLKPHGRKAWNLYLFAGIKIDLSVMPRIASALV